MAVFLIQVSGKSIHENADPAYVAGTSGDRFCDEPLRHGEYFNASPYWQEEGYGRRDAWKAVGSGDQVLLYCTSSVDEHGASLSHLLGVESATLDREDGARIEFDDVRELIPNVEHARIRAEIEAGRFSEQMRYCGQQGFNFTEVEESDLDRVTELSNLSDPL